MPEFQLDSTPYPTPYVPFANEDDVQAFVEANIRDILGLEVIASTTRGRKRLLKIDTLAIDKSNRPYIIECKWDRVDEVAIEELTRYRLALLSSWSQFEKRVSEFRNCDVRVNRQEPVLITVGYRYKASIVAEHPSIVFLRYAYHEPEFTRDAVQERRAGKVKMDRIKGTGVSNETHPAVSKKHYTSKRLAVMPTAVQRAFETTDAKLRKLRGVNPKYDGKNSVRYYAFESLFAQAVMTSASIAWFFKGSGDMSGKARVAQANKGKGKLDFVCGMVTEGDVDEVYRLLHGAYVEVVRLSKQAIRHG
jgi:hypothetical protein